MVFANRFRHDLSHALPLWLSDELVTPAQAERLRAYYRLDELDAAGRGGFVAVLLTFGALLVGLGVISFVAANWSSISPEVRAIGGAILLVALNVLGYAWWSRPEKRRWGSAALALAGFMLGGELVLMAQWFQVSGSTAGLFFAWGLGCLAMGAGLAHGLSIAMAAALFIGALAYGAEHAWAYPWLFALVILPLGTWVRSGAVWLVGAVGLSVSAGVLVGPAGPAYWIVAQLAVGLALWSAAEIAATRGPLQALRLRLNAREHQRDEQPLETAVGRPFALVLLLGVLQVFAFSGAWAMLDDGPGWIGEPAIASGLVGVALAIALYLRARRRLAEPLLHAVVGAVVAVTAGLLLAGAAVDGLWLLANGLLLGLQLALAWRGLRLGERWWFWLGFGSLSVQVFARFMEFDTGLLLKSLAFVLWGVAMIAVGVLFERGLQRQLARV